MKKSLAIASLIAFVSMSVFAGPYDKPGFVTFEVDGRVWVFKTDSDALKQFQEHGEPAKQVTLIGKGPKGKTLKSDDMKTAEEYLKLLKKAE